MAKKSYAWFERRRKTKVLDLTQDQITKALDTVTLLHEIIKGVSESKKPDSMPWVMYPLVRLMTG